MGAAAPATSEETDFLLQFVSLPDGEVVELLDGHPENTEELLLREVSLQGRETYRDTERERGSSVNTIYLSTSVSLTVSEADSFTSSLVLSTPGGSLLRPL